MEHRLKETSLEAEIFHSILELGDVELRWLVDRYNSNQLSQEACVALEAIEAMGGNDD